jgi:hypothetical protein
MREAGRGRTLSNRDREILGETAKITISRNANGADSYIDDILFSLEKKN